jgi:hypothetical protein
VKPKPAKLFNAALADDSEPVIVNNHPAQHLPGSKKSLIDDHRKRDESAKHGTAKHPTVPTSGVQLPPTLSSTSSAVVSYACLLCKRQFKSAEQLSRHEKESELHAENLLNQNQLQADKSSSDNVPQYKDRAAERRAT